MYPVLFEIGPFQVRAYGTFIALAFLTAFTLLYRQARKQRFYPEKIMNLTMIILVSGIIGSRILHVLVNLSYYARNPVEIFFVWKGGLAIYGGIFFATIVSYIYLKKNKIPFLRMADFIIPYLALGQSIGRIGCFFNGCCFGKPTDAHIWGVIFPGDIVYRYPTQLYASFALFLIFIILKRAQKRSFFTGYVLGLYSILYSVQRFLIDFLRGDTSRYLMGLTVSQIISIFLLTGTALIMLFFSKKILHPRS